MIDDDDALEVVSVRPAVYFLPQVFFRFRSNLVWVMGRPRPVCVPVWPWPDPRSRSRSRSFWTCESCTFLGLSSPPLSRGAQKW